MDTYAVVRHWGGLLQSACETCQCDYVVDLLHSSDLTTPKGIKDLSDVAVARLQNNLVPGVHEAIDLWQATQCLKKFRHGCAASPEEMLLGWLDRNMQLRDVRLPLWLRMGMRGLLAPLGQAYLESEGQTGRFGNGAVYERGVKSLHAKWQQIATFPYNARDPENLSQWSPSSSDSARLSCVPKDMLKLRTITVEPVEATFLQQLIRARLILSAAKVLPSLTAIPAQVWGGGPEIQRDRALAGSLHGTLATIDLSDASDSISWQDVVDVFPTCIVADLERSRSPYTEVCMGANPVQRVETFMFAGMGNATTFIVESLYFWALFTTICQRLRFFTTVSVFGDDIVVPTRAARHPLFSKYAQDAHVKLNMAKCGMSSGPGFREACGLAAYYGSELPLLRISGYHLDKPVELVSLCSLVNCCLEPDSRYAPFVRTLGEVVGKDLVERLGLPVTPYRLSQDGVYIADSSERVGVWSYRSRWNPELQHPEVKVRVLEQTRVTRAYRDCTLAEGLGIIHGQLRTRFADAPLGYQNRRVVFEYPTNEASLRTRWVPCWSSDATLTAFGG